MINATLGPLGEPEAAVASIGVLPGATLFVSAPLWAFQSTAIVFGRTSAGRRAVIRSALLMSAAVSAATCVLLAAWGPRAFLADVFRLEGRTLELAAGAAFLVALDPLAHGLRSVASGLLIGAGRTRAAGMATTFKILVTAAAGVVALGGEARPNGAAWGMATYVAGTTTDLLILAFLARRIGRGA